MTKEQLKKLIDIAAGRKTADLVIKNAKIVDVYSSKILVGDIAISDNLIAGIGNYQGRKEIDVNGKYVTPGFIDGHIHIESSYLSPEELGKLLVPHGGTCIIADPHEIVNVCGIKGLDYMMEAAKNTVLDIKYMVPSCVPCTPFENAGAIIDADKMKEPITRENVLGLGEFMNFPGVISGDSDVLDKIMVAKENGKIIDGHSPSIFEKNLNAYVSVGIRNDHECATVEEMHDRISRGVYVLLRQGSACHDLRNLLKGVTKENSRRCVLCSDDRQPKTIFELGHLDNHLQICVEEGIDPIIAVQMATLNAAECFGLKDRGAIAPGLRADLVVMEDLKDFKITNVFIQGEEVAKDGKYLPEIQKYDTSSVRGSMHVKDFSIEKLKLNLKTNKVHIIDILPGGVVTKKSVDTVELDENGEFIFNPEKDIVKVAVVERHKNTGNVAVGFLRGYGIKEGAVALSVAHDSHNLIVVGTSNEDMAFAIEKLIEQEGGVVLVKNGEVIENMPMPIAGLMSDKDGEWVDKKLTSLHNKAFEELGIHQNVEPVMTLCFMSLVVIPEIKITDKGLFDIMKFDFISLEAE
ncbi:adenine deaminase [Fusobacterium sp.]|uniref:adenine deaminase n=1 Tax=Fusobacterium sp. TaxID=68766 RepID=UPI00262FE439|nr:adenine deaminase [Fusobacterium sp.]